MTGIKRSLGYQSLYQVLVLVVPLVTAPYVSRVLGAEGVGDHTFTLSVAQWFVLFAGLGIYNHGSRAVAQARACRASLDKAFSSLFVAHLAVSCAVLVAYLLFVAVFGGGNEGLLLIQGIWIVGAILNIDWFYFGIEQFRVTVTWNSVTKILTVAAVFLFVRGADDVWVYALILALGTAVGQSVVWLFVRRFVSFVRPTWRATLAHARPLLVLFVPVIMVSVYKILSRVLLGGMAGEAELAWFANAEKIVTVPLGLVAAFGTVMLSRASAVHAQGDPGGMRQLTGTAARYVGLLAFGLTWGLAAVGREFAPMFFGREFTESGTLIVTMSVIIPFMAFSTVARSLYLIPRSLDSKFIIAAGAGAGVSLLLNLVLIPRHGASGAVVALIAAEAVAGSTQMYFARGAFKWGQLLQDAVVFAVAGLVMFGAVRGVGHVLSSIDSVGAAGAISLQVSLGALVYIILGAGYLFVVRDHAFLGMLQSVRSSLRRGQL